MIFYPRKKTLLQVEQESRNSSIVSMIDPITKNQFSRWSDSEEEVATFYRVPYRIFHLYPFYLVKNFVTDFRLGKYDDKSVDFVRDLDVYIADLITINERYLSLKEQINKGVDPSTLKVDGRNVFISTSEDASSGEEVDIPLSDSTDYSVNGSDFLDNIEIQNKEIQENIKNEDNDKDVYKSEADDGCEYLTEKFPYLDFSLLDDQYVRPYNYNSSLPETYLQDMSEVRQFQDVFEQMDSDWSEAFIEPDDFGYIDVDEAVKAGGSVENKSDEDGSDDYANDKDVIVPKWKNIDNTIECKDTDGDYNEDYYIPRNSVVDWYDPVSLHMGCVPYLLDGKSVEELRESLYTYPQQVRVYQKGGEVKIQGMGDYMLKEGQYYDKRGLLVKLIKVYTFRNIFHDDDLVGFYGDVFDLDKAMLDHLDYFLTAGIVGHVENPSPIDVDGGVWVRRYYRDICGVPFSVAFEEILTRYEMCYQLLLANDCRIIKLPKSDMGLIREWLFYLLGCVTNRIASIQRDHAHIVDRDKLFFLTLYKLDPTQLFQLYVTNAVTSYHDYLLTMLELRLSLDMKIRIVDYLAGFGYLESVM